MPRVSDYLDDDYLDELPVRETIRRSTKPVSERHDFQRRAENAVNRWRKDSRLKEKNQ